MAPDKTLPEWAVPGTKVLLRGYGDLDYTKRVIERVTKTSAFLTDKSRFVVAGYDPRKEHLEEYGSGSNTWRGGRTIQPMDGDRAKGMLLRKERLQNARDFEALMNAALKGMKTHDPETELNAVKDLIAGATVRQAQLEVLVAEKAERDRQRAEDEREYARLRRERQEREAQL
jgi:hypothetical protein